MSKQPRPSSISAIALRAALLPLKAVIALVVFFDEVLRPIYRPIVKRVLAHPFFVFLDRQVSRLPRWAILIVFAVPFLIAEPLKLVAIILFAKGRAVSGTMMFLFAQLLTFILVERIYHAGRTKLLTYWWFSWAVNRAAEIRDTILATAKRIVHRLRTLAGLHA